MKKNFFNLLFLLPILFFSYYFFVKKQDNMKINWKPFLNEDLKANFYTKENLYDYLNGGAEKIIERGFLYLKVWEGTKFTLELYYFDSKSGSNFVFEKYLKKEKRTFKDYFYEMFEDQGIALAGKYLLKIYSYSRDNLFMENQIKNFLEWAYENKL